MPTTAAQERNDGRLLASPIRRVSQGPGPTTRESAYGLASLVLFGALLAASTAIALAAARPLQLWAPVWIFGLSARVRSKGLSRSADSSPSAAKDRSAIRYRE